MKQNCIASYKKSWHRTASLCATQSSILTTLDLTILEMATVPGFVDIDNEMDASSTDDMTTEWDATLHLRGISSDTIKRLPLR